MKVVVIGGTGLIGSKVVAKLTEQGHQSIAATPASGVNTFTGDGAVRHPLRGLARRQRPRPGPVAR